MKRFPAIQIAALAIGLVLSVGTTAFKATASNNPNDPTYYWYRVNASGEIVNGSIQFSGAMKTVTYADANDGCSGTPADCLRGFSSPIPSGNFPTDDAGDVQTHKSL